MMNEEMNGRTVNRNSLGLCGCWKRGVIVRFREDLDEMNIRRMIELTLVGVSVMEGTYMGKRGYNQMS